MKYSDTRLTRMLRLVLCYIALILGFAGMAQKSYVNKEWSETIGLPDTLNWSASVFDFQGNVIMAGNTMTEPGNPDVLINKYDRDGGLMWERTFDGEAHGPDYGAAVATDNYGNAFIAAATTSVNGMQDIVVLKYDEEGDLVWHSTWDGVSNLIDAPTSIKLDPAGNIYVAGITYSTFNNVDYVLLKFDASGNLLWHSNYDHSGSIDIAVGLELNANNDPVVSGASSATPGIWEYATVGYNKINGGQTDAQRVSVPGVSINSALAFTRDIDGHFFLTGFSGEDDGRDMQTVKLTGGFTLDWARTYDGDANRADVGKAIGVDPEGQAYVAGYSDLAEGGSLFMTVKYDAQGNTLWTREFKPKEPEYRAEAEKLAVTQDGGVLVVGTVFNGETNDFLTVKYAADGKQEWYKYYDGLNGDDKALGLIAVGKEAYVSGITGEGPTKTYSMVKYRYTTVKDSAVVDSSGTPICMDRQLIVSFRKPVVNTEWVDKKEIQFSTLDKALDPATADVVAHKLNISSGGKVPVYKVFFGMTTADSISISRLGEEVPMPEFWRVLKIGLPEGTDLLAAIDSLNTLNQEITYAQVNNIYQPYDIPNDPLLHRQPSLVPTASYPNADINVDPAWDIQTGIPEVKVGIVDDMVEGINRDGAYNEAVEDLGDHVAGGYDYVWNGWQYQYQEFHPFSEHGTACAGIVGAIRNNGIGIAGIAGGTGAPNTGCSLYSAGIVDGYVYMQLDDIAPAIVDASTDGVGFDWIPGCNILNLSWGAGPRPEAFSPALIQAVVNAYHNQCMVVAARGNSGDPGPYAVTFPSCYGGTYLDENGILSIGASGTDGLSMTFANGPFYTQYGNDMDLVAPGATQIIASTVGHHPTNFPLCQPGLPAYYDCFQGTSAAAPHAAGVAALMMSEHNVLSGAANDLAPEDVEHIMESTATDDLNGPGTYDDPNGWGRLNAGEAVRQVASPYWVFHSTSVHPVPTTFPSETIHINSWVNAWSGSWDLPAGDYTAARTEVQFSYSNTFGPDYTVLDVWNRESSTLGISNNPNVDGRYDANYIYNIDPTTATVNVTATTNCWYVMADANGNPVNQWIPAPPQDLMTAYSVHLLGPETGVSVEEVSTPSDFSVYPSPASDFVNIRLPGGLPPNTTLDVLDITGRIVLHRKVNSGMQTLQIAVEGWADGVYCLRLNQGSSIRSTRFVKH
ncbi:MAG: S8 family serine peptidase [Flavobacteriales bacterium]|nr:S8 family serine peptidase [Flavobacteriales bacterium]